MLVDGGDLLLHGAAAALAGTIRAHLGFGARLPVGRQRGIVDQCDVRCLHLGAQGAQRIAADARRAAGFGAEPEALESDQRFLRGVD